MDAEGGSLTAMGNDETKRRCGVQPKSWPLRVAGSLACILAGEGEGRDRLGQGWRHGHRVGFQPSASASRARA